MNHVLHVVGARPNYMKMAPVYRALCGSVRQTVVHTGQHYDALMSDIFFRQLNLPAPDFNLGVGSGTHGVQIGQIMIRLEPVVRGVNPDLVLVYGDVNSTVAAALVGSKLSVKVGHVEAGLRSWDRGMPEEINRIITDAIADLLFTHSADADDNLAREGIPDWKVHRVGNVMIDTLVQLLPLTDPATTRERLGLRDAYGLVTLHRPSNVDDPVMLRTILDTLAQLTDQLDVVFPMHPRTKSRVVALGFVPPKGMQCADPLGYLEFLGLQREASMVITDSGGVQEEATYLGVPCLTMRSTTERPITVTVGTNVLVGTDMERLQLESERVLTGHRRRSSVPPLWDGHAGDRIAEVVCACVVRRMESVKRLVD